MTMIKIKDYRDLNGTLIDLKYAPYNLVHIRPENVFFPNTL